MGITSLQSDRVLVLLWRCGGVLAYFHYIYLYLHCHHCYHGCRIHCLIISVHPIPHFCGGFDITCAHPYNTSVFNAVVVIGDVIILAIAIDISNIIIDAIIIFLSSQSSSVADRNNGCVIIPTPSLSPLWFDNSSIPSASAPAPFSFT